MRVIYSTCILLSIYLLGCSTTLMPPELAEGKTFSVQLLESLQVGMTEEQVIEIIGQPWKVFRDNSQSRFEYLSQIEQFDVVRYMYIFSSRKRIACLRNEAVLWFEDSRLQRIEHGVPETACQ